MAAKHEFGKNASFIHELYAFMMQSKKWWLFPIIVVILLMGIFIMLGGTAAAPFIYALF